jgi:hypothetical protein
MSATSSFEVPNMTTSPTSSVFGSLSMSSLKKTLKKIPVAAGIAVAVVVCVAVLLLNNKVLYKLTNQYLGRFTGSTYDEEKKCPTSRGVLVHAVLGALVFGVVVYFVYDQVIHYYRKALN